jgi:hypothetical protein
MMSVSAASFAAPNLTHCTAVHEHDACMPKVKSKLPPAKAPEVDPASTLAGLTMLAGGVTVLRGRRLQQTRAS